MDSPYLIFCSGERVDDKGAMALAELLGRERQLRDRNTQLLVPGRNFTAVLSILAAWQVRSSYWMQRKAWLGLWTKQQ